VSVQWVGVPWKPPLARGLAGTRMLEDNRSAGFAGSIPCGASPRWGRRLRRWLGCPGAVRRVGSSVVDALASRAEGDLAGRRSMGSLVAEHERSVSHSSKGLTRSPSGPIRSHALAGRNLARGRLTGLLGDQLQGAGRGLRLPRRPGEVLPGIRRELGGPKLDHPPRKRPWIPCQG